MEFHIKIDTAKSRRSIINVKASLVIFSKNIVFCFSEDLSCLNKQFQNLMKCCSMLHFI